MKRRIKSVLLAVASALCAGSALAADSPVRLQVQSESEAGTLRLSLTSQLPNCRPVLIDTAVAPRPSVVRPNTVVRVTLRDKHGALLESRLKGALDMVGVGPGELVAIGCQTELAWSIDLAEFPWLFPVEPGHDYTADVCVQGSIGSFVAGSPAFVARLSELGFSKDQLVNVLHDFEVCQKGVAIGPSHEAEAGPN